MAKREQSVRINLITGLDVYTGQNATDPRSSRVLTSWIPWDDGQLHRELPQPLYVPTQLSGPVVGIYDFAHNDDSGAVTHFYFAAARTDSSEGTVTCSLYLQVGSAWTLVTEVGTLADAPMFITIQNQLQLVDGERNWTFDGSAWFKTGIDMPWQGGTVADGPNKGSIDSNAKGIEWTVAIDATAAGSFSPVIGRYYWFTNADHTTTRPNHESSSSNIGTITGPLTNKEVKVYQTPGLWSVTSGSKKISIVASADNPGPTKPVGFSDPGALFTGIGTFLRAFKGKTLYLNGQLIGVIDSFDTFAGNNFITLEENSPATIVNGRPVCVDARCTHWHIYASESDGSKVGQFLSVPNPGGTAQNFGISVNRDLSTDPVIDESPFISDPDNNFLPIFRPVRNDPPPSSRILETHKYRAWRVRSSRPNFFDFTANEEVLSGSNGSPIDSVPGATTFYEGFSALISSTTKAAGAGVDVPNGTPTTHSQGPFSPSTHANSGSGEDWTLGVFPNECDFIANGDSKFLHLTSFGFSIPAGATIIGVVASMTRQATAELGGGVTEKNVQLLKASVATGNNRGSGAWPKPAPGVKTYGGPTDLWGATLSDSDVNNSGFGIRVQVTGHLGLMGEDTTAILSAVTLTVYYTTGTFAWTNPNNITSAVSFATATLNLTSSNPAESDFLQTTQFGYAITHEDMIQGIQIAFDAKIDSSLPSGVTAKIVAQLMKNGVVVGDIKEQDISNTTVSTFTLGATDDLWGFSWTAEDVDQTTWGVQFTAVLSDTGSTGVARTISIRNGQAIITFADATEDEVNTLSDIINEVSYPDQSNRIRGLKSHTDALYMFSERQCFPLYGESIDDFAISQVTSFNVGLAGRFAVKSTPHGLAFVSFDKKALLYPSNSVPSGNATEMLVEFGHAIRTKLDQIDPTRKDEVVTEFFFYGKRNWFLIGYPDTDGNFQTLVYDFNTKGWFQTQRGFSSFGIIELNGTLILLGGAPDGFVYVIEDQSGSFTSSDDLPVATWRPALIDFGDPANSHIFNWIELEFSSTDLADEIQVTYWLDPSDADNPGTGQTLTLTRVRGANYYRGAPQGGATCRRLLLEIQAAAGQTGGVLRGAKLVSYKVTGLLT